MRQKKIFRKTTTRTSKIKKTLNKKKTLHKKNKTNPLKNQKRKTPISKTKKRSQSMCAPFIQPLDLSSESTITQTNINIIKSATDESCFSLDALRKIADKWNTTHPDKAIEYTDATTGKSLWNSIKNAMSSKCNNEICWLKQDFIKGTPIANELLNNFKPLTPTKWKSNPREWLNTIDIRNVMNQYEIKHPDFEFIGPVPMDFDSKVGFGQCVINELCNIKLASLLEKGKRKLGVIFNLDKHTQPGSHWVAMWAHFPQSSNGNGNNNDNNNIVNTNGFGNDKSEGVSSASGENEICYWDSYGMKPNPEVVILMNRLATQAKEQGLDASIKINKHRHQYKNTECGVYCIYFLTSFLEGRAFEDIVGNIISDDKMFEKRKEFFTKA